MNFLALLFYTFYYMGLFAFVYCLTRILMSSAYDRKEKGRFGGEL
ncbi:hypothetical protein ACIQZO_23010 [Streptomyces sp. NPDC097617]